MAKQRSIFEEVSAEKSAPETVRAAAPGVIDRARSGARRGIVIWLSILFAMVVVMIAVGGLTRLTDSGLSITEWAPVTGAVPPLSAADWATAFEKYQQIPEYRLQNSDMTLAEFKTIYWWEWGHRQLGRVIGLFWAVGFLGFLLSRKIPTGWTGRLVLPGLLGGLQGAIGWWMVSSGLGGEALDVASYRLAVHLGLAFLILGLLGWYILKLSRPERDLLQARRQKDDALWRLTGALLGLTFVQILLGALVAGIDAGRAFPTWPLMGDSIFPAGALDIVPLWRNFFENAGLVQFMHRVAGYAVLLFAVVVWLKGRRSVHQRTRRAVDWMMVFTFGQVVIGIGTVLSQAQWHIAITHQIIAVLVWTLILRARFLSGYPVAGSIRDGV